MVPETILSLCRAKKVEAVHVKPSHLTKSSGRRVWHQMHLKKLVSTVVYLDMPGFGILLHANSMFHDKHTLLLESFLVFAVQDEMNGSISFSSSRERQGRSSPPVVEGYL